MDLRNVGLHSFSKMAFEGVRHADLELTKNEAEPSGYVRPRVRDHLESTTRELAALSRQVADSFDGKSPNTEASAWNGRKTPIGLNPPPREGVSDHEAARAISDITAKALEMAARRPLPVQIGIYQGTLLAISSMSEMSLPKMGEAAQKLLDGQNIRMRTDLAALNTASAAAPTKAEAPAKDAADSTKAAESTPAAEAAPVARKKRPRLTWRGVDSGGEALVSAGAAALARAAAALGDATAMSVLGNAAMGPASQLAVIAACAPPAVPAQPNAA